MRGLAMGALLIMTFGCSGGTSTVRTLATIPPASCALLDEKLATSIQGEVLRPPFSSTVRDHLFGFFTVEADWDAIVYMKADATPEPIEAVRGQLEGDARVASFVYLDHDAAYAEFQSLFADQPGIGGSLTAADTPTSFKLKLKDRATTEEMDRSYNRQPGVYSFIAPSDASKRARAEQFREMKPKLATLRTAGVTSALLRLIVADEHVADRMIAQPTSPIMGIDGALSDDAVTQLRKDASDVQAEIARDCASGPSS